MRVGLCVLEWAASVCVVGDAHHMRTVACCDLEFISHENADDEKDLLIDTVDTVCSHVFIQTCVGLRINCEDVMFRHGHVCSQS